MATMSLMCSMLRVRRSISARASTRSASRCWERSARYEGSNWPLGSLARNSASCPFLSRSMAAAFRDERGGDVHAIEHIADVVEHARGDFRHARLPRGVDELLLRPLQFL